MKKYKPGQIITIARTKYRVKRVNDKKKAAPCLDCYFKSGINICEQYCYKDDHPNNRKIPDDCIFIPLYYEKEVQTR